MKQTDLEDLIAATPPKGESAALFEQSVQSQYLDDFGREIPNPVPMQPPIGYRKQPTIAEQMRAMIKQASYEAATAGAETEDEANDFDIDEDYDPSSPWENDFDVDPALEVMLARQSAPPQVPPAPPAPASATSTASSPHQPHAPAEGTSTTAQK